MGEIELSVIIPSVGRATLARTLRSLIRQAGDLSWEAVVVGDSHAGTWRAQLDALHELMWRADCELLGTAPDERAEYVPSGQLLYVEHDGGLHCYGQPQRNFGALVARGQYLAWLGDDDIYLPGAFASIAAHIRASEPAPHLFRWISPWKTLLWEAPGSIGVEPGHIDAECIITPNLEQYLGTWENRYQGDFDFIQGTLERWARAGVPPRWCAETIAQAQPSELEDWTRHDALTREQAYARQTA